MKIDPFEDYQSTREESGAEFKKWLETYLDSDTPTGDIARDVYADRDFPKKGTFNSCYAYVDSRSQGGAALSAFHDAWEAFREEV